MGLIILVAALFAATLAGFALVLARLAATRRELAQVREALDVLANNRTAFWSAAPAREERAEAKRAAFASVDVALVKPAANDAPTAQTHRDARAPVSRVASRPLASIEDQDDAPNFDGAAPNLSPENARAIVVAVALALPTIGFAFAAPTAAIVAAALVLASAALLISLRAAWRHTAWFATLGAGAWAITGLVAGVGTAQADLFATALAISAAAGLTHARAQRPAAPGLALTTIMAAAALIVGADLGLVGAAGASYGVIVALGAAIGASTLRLEAVHLGAFAAAGLGLYVLSAQQPAGVWFTPAAVWTGMWFLAIAFLRVPVLGPRGTLIAATGATAPVFAVSALYAARHGLENAFTAAAGYMTLALMFAAIITLAARRHDGLAKLHLALWALAIPAVACGAIAILLALPAPLEPAALAAFALGLVALDTRWPDRFWRFAITAIAALTAITGAATAQQFGALDTSWSPLWLALYAVAIPAGFLGVAAHFAAPRAPITAAILEALAIVGAALAGSAALRLAFSLGVPALEPVSFVETGAHAALWLGLALLLAWRGDDGARWVRGAASIALASAGLLLAFGCLLAWLAPWWAAPLDAPSALHPPLGFALPAVAAWAHWAFWRGRGAERRARIAFASAALLTAAWATLELVSFNIDAADWVTATIGACAFALAAGLNFVPGLATPRAAPAV